MNRAAIEWARDRTLASEASAHPPETVAFLLRLYVSGDSLVLAHVEQGLTAALARAGSETDPCGRMHWLHLLAEAAAVSDDERLRPAVTRALPDAVDALEALIRRTYEPGDGLPGLDCAAHLRSAAALLAAFDLSGRLPYAMLAEELFRHARRRWSPSRTGVFDADFIANCTALRVLCRLSALHGDADYLAAAVVAPGSDYASEAGPLAEWVSARSGEYPDAAGSFGGALLEWFALTGLLH